MGLSKEEKKAKKEAKRLEKLKAEEELKKQIKREELERELAAHAIKRGELDKSWKKMMLRIKEPIFKQDIQVMWQTFERALDKKDHQMQCIMKLMDVAENQFQVTIANFCEVIDTMINNFLVELEKLSKENESRTENCLKSGQEELSQITTDYNAAERHLQLLLFHGYTTADSLAWTTRGVNLVKEDEERMKYINERDNLRSYLEHSYSHMWDTYKSVLKLYITDTAENQKQMRKLRRKERTMSDIIASQAKRITNNDGLLKRLRSELAGYESGTKQAEFRERRNRFRNACHSLKKRLSNDCALDETQMALLVSESNNTIEWLESGYKKGEKILRLAALCRKFETQREKVLPFNYTVPQSQDMLSLKNTQSDDDSLIVHGMSSSNGLTRLWQKISNAELSKRALLQEKKLLEKQNMMIARKLQEYEDETIKPSDRKICSCVTQSGEISKPTKLKKPTKPVAIEAVLEVHKFMDY